MGWLELIAAIAGSAAGEAASSMDQGEVMRLIKGVSDEFGRIDVPKLQQLLLQKQSDTRLAGIKDDPTYRAQQNAADAQLNDVIGGGGLTIADRAALNAVRNRTARTASAGRNAILGGMAARGSLDSGAQLAAQLSENQDAAELAAAAGADTAGRAQARSFEAIRERARNAGAGLDRSFQQEATKAAAQDAINAGNTAIANTAARYNAGIPQQNFENQVRLAGAKAQPAYALAGAHAAKAKDTKQAWQAGANAAGKAAQGGYDAYKAASTEPAASGSGREDALGGDATRPQRQVIGHRLDGTPIYSEDLR